MGTLALELNVAEVLPLFVKIVLCKEVLMELAAVTVAKSGRAVRLLGRTVVCDGQTIDASLWLLH